MQYTSNYNLITVEGTDVVNPLVQMNPNFTDIDAAMFANKQASIGTATELAAGTVHSITRANADSDYFRFTATSNWNSGDTMNVDGVNVSVFLTDGTTPGTGCYVINSEVFAMISGTRVTLFVSESKITTISAQDVTFDPTGTTIPGTETDADAAIKYVNDKVDDYAYHAITVDYASLPNYSSGSVLAKADAGIIVFNASLVITGAAAAGTTIATIPATEAPTSARTLIFNIIPSGGQIQSCQAVLFATGELKIYPSADINVQISVVGNYVAMK